MASNLERSPAAGACRLWVESAHSSSRAVCTVRGENALTAALIETIDQRQDAEVRREIERIIAAWRLGDLAFSSFTSLLGGISFSIVQIREGHAVRMLCHKSPFPVWIRGQEVNPFSFEERKQSRSAFHEACFEAQLGDYGVIVNEGYLATTGYDWDCLATSIRRWAETGCDAFQLRDCLIRTGQRLATSCSRTLYGCDLAGVKPAATDNEKMAVLAMRIRPLVSATVWTGPSLRRGDDRIALDALMAETGLRIICGDTTAQIAARLLGRPLRVEQSAAPRRAKIPPLSYLEGLDLVTEGLITLRQATEWLRGAETVRDLPRSADAAARLAHALLSADQIRFIVGQAVNPAQITEVGSGVSPRLAIVGELIARLRAQGKVVYITYL